MMMLCSDDCGRFPRPAMRDDDLTETLSRSDYDLNPTRGNEPSLDSNFYHAHIQSRDADLVCPIF